MMKVHVRSRRVSALGLAALVLAAFVPAAQTAAADGLADQVERGRYIASLGNCAGCHTAPGGRPYAGGVELHTPFGVLVGSNITPDAATGIGLWTDDEFVTSLHEGRGRGGERIYPAMPYPYYTKMSRRDALDLRAYLATVAPVANKVVSNRLPFPFNVRASLAAWNAINFKAGRYVPDPVKSAEWNRGAELVNGVMHCGACHTPKSSLGGNKPRARFEGAVLEGWQAPDITTNAVKGVGGWDADDIVQYLKTGSNSFTLAFGPMAQVVMNSTSKMTDGDLAAVAQYLKDSGTMSAGAKPTALPADAPEMKVGAAIYADACAACHKMTGAGDSSLFPGLAGSSLVHADDATTMVRIVLQGARAAGTAAKPTAPQMPAFGWRLTDGQLAAVVTYVRNTWGNAAPAVTAGSVASTRAALAQPK